MRLLTATAALIALSHSAMAQPSDSDQSLKLNGYLDTYYQYSPQGHGPGVGAGSPFVEGRVFDNLHNQVLLNMVEISATKKTNDLFFRVDLAFGQQVDAMATNGTIGATTGQPAGADSEPTRNITQAFLSYSPKALSDLTITAGKFLAFIGLEGFKAKDNWQYSRSFSYNFNPYWHQGLSVKYAVIPEKVSATVFFINASDGRLSQETNRSTSIGANININPADGWTANYNYLGGSETALPNSRREVHELNSTYQVTSKVAVAADYAYAIQKNVLANGEDGHWWAVDAYIKLQPVTWYYLSPRYEYLDDSDQGVGLSAFSSAGGVKQKVQGITVTNAFQLPNGLELRLEFRSDRSDKDGYFKSSSGGNSKTQDTYTAAALYAF